MTTNTPTSGAADLPEPHFGEGRHLGLAFRADAYSVAQVQALFASRGQSPSPQAAQQPAPSSAATVGNSGFDYQTAADLLSGKTVSDETMRKFVMASRWAHDDRSGLRATLLSVRGELASREAEIALLKNALMDAEESRPSPTPQAAQHPAPSAAVVDAGFLRAVITLCNNRGASPESIEGFDSDDRWIADLWRQAEHLIATAPQADGQPVVDRARIREIFIAHGFTVKEGQTDLKQYVYDAADALLRAARAPADSVLEDAALWFAERDNVLHSFWVLLGEAEVHADNDNNPLLKHQVEEFYRQWNALNGTTLGPRWVSRAARKQGGA